MAFAVDDLVQIVAAKSHPALAGNTAGYGRVMDTNVNGNSTLYRVAVNGHMSLYLMDATELATVTGPISSGVTIKLLSSSPAGKTSVHKR